MPFRINVCNACAALTDLNLFKSEVTTPRSTDMETTEELDIIVNTGGPDTEPPPLN